jgi:hypothetical protein
LVLSPQQVLDIKEFAKTESDNNEILLNLIDTIAYLSNELNTKINPCEYISRDVSRCKNNICHKVNCPLYKSK